MHNREHVCSAVVGWNVLQIWVTFSGFTVLFKPSRLTFCLAVPAILESGVLKSLTTLLNCLLDPSFRSICFMYFWDCVNEADTDL